MKEKGYVKRMNFNINLPSNRCFKNEEVIVNMEEDEYEALSINYIVYMLNELSDENRYLKTKLKIFEMFLKENDLDIEWEHFCTIEECPVTDEDEISCEECKYLGVD